MMIPYNKGWSWTQTQALTESRVHVSNDSTFDLPWRFGPCTYVLELDIPIHSKAMGPSNVTPRWELLDSREDMNSFPNFTNIWLVGKAELEHMSFGLKSS